MAVNSIFTLNMEFFHNLLYYDIIKLMPSWNIHLEAGNRLADSMKLSGLKRKEFLLGCLLPDINNGYINNVKTKKQHDETHYAFDQKSSLNFYAENKPQIDAKELIFLGYILHLYTDGFFNYDFYRTIKRHPLGEGLTREEKRKIKHHDFWIYDTKFHHCLNLKQPDLDYLAKKANQISVIELTPADIMDVERILKDTDFRSARKKEKYLFYTEKRLDELLEDMLESFKHDYLGEEYA